MLKIGEFARKNKVTVRALRHYEEIGLLEPTETDRFTGYRYYAESQAKKLRIINVLKTLGFSLSEIGELLTDSVTRDNLLSRLNDKYLQTRIDLDKAQTRSLGIEELLKVIKAMPGGKRVNLMEVSEMNMNNIAKRLPMEEVFMENFEELLRKAKETDRNITIMVIDIDKFKQINDEYGHKIGDAVLDAIQRGIIEKLPGGHGMLWGKRSALERKGGDEYIIRVEIEEDKGILLAEEICSHVGNMDFNYLGVKKPITVSMGIAGLSSNPADAKEFTHLAGSAMYLAKHNGRNRCEVYTGDIKEKLNTIR